MSGGPFGPVEQLPLPVVVRDDISQDITQDWCSKFNLIENTGSSTLQLTLTVDSSRDADAEIIIRNLSTALGSVRIVAGPGVTLDIAPELGTYIGAGGIAELKRLGASNVWSMYGFVSGS